MMVNNLYYLDLWIMQKKNKLWVYKTIIRPVLLYHCEACTLTQALGSPSTHSTLDGLTKVAIGRLLTHNNGSSSGGRSLSPRWPAVKGMKFHLLWMKWLVAVVLPNRSEIILIINAIKPVKGVGFGELLLADPPGFPELLLPSQIQNQLQCR